MSAGRTVLWVSSGGGHWVQMTRLSRAVHAPNSAFVSVKPDYAAEVSGSRYHQITDGTRWSPGSLLRTLVELLRVFRIEKPAVVVSTGAAPGFLAILLGKVMGARTVWMDSIANVERLSMSGRMVRPLADLWLTQWPRVAERSGAEFAGSVIG